MWRVCYATFGRETAANLVGKVLRDAVQYYVKNMYRAVPHKNVNRTNYGKPGRDISEVGAAF